MNHHSRLALLAALALVCVPATAQDTVIWGIGQQAPGDDSAKEGGQEFLQNKTFHGTFTFIVESFSDLTPRLPGYLASGPITNWDPTGTADSAETLELVFTTEGTCFSTALTLGRFGSENNELELLGSSGNVILSLRTHQGAGEESQVLPVFVSNVPLVPDTYTLRIRYLGGGQGNGNYLDYLQLEGDGGCSLSGPY